MEYGLIGGVLGHSFSKEVHEQIENYNYELCEIAADKLDDFMIKRDFKAINVTIPYKQAVIPHLTSVSPQAELIGAVNTVVNRNGELHGYNTDFFGMTDMLNRIGINLKGKKVLILGTGGTSKTAYAVACHQGAAQILKVSRNPGDGVVTYEDMYKYHTDAHVIINTTPCGMYPHCNEIPVDIDSFHCLEGVADAIYNPLRPKLVCEAQKRGIPAEGGLYMLVAQAVYAAELFTGKIYDKTIIDVIYNKIYSQKQNIVLIGMPASGKTTVGKLIAEISGREFTDTDEIVVQHHKMTIPDIFASHGELTFRQWESDAVELASKFGCSVIATGGGAILKSANVDALRRNGKLYFLDRPLADLIPTDDRPLGNDADALKKRYDERYDIYCATADEIIKIDDNPGQIAAKIMKIHEPDERIR